MSEYTYIIKFLTIYDDVVEVKYTTSVADDVEESIRQAIRDGTWFIAGADATIIYKGNKLEAIDMKKILGALDGETEEVND